MINLSHNTYYWFCFFGTLLTGKWAWPRTTRAPNGMGSPNPTKKLAHLADLLGQPLYRNHVFEIFSGEPPLIVTKHEMRGVGLVGTSSLKLATLVIHVNINHENFKFLLGDVSSVNSSSSYEDYFPFWATCALAEKWAWPGASKLNQEVTVHRMEIWVNCNVQQI